MAYPKSRSEAKSVGESFYYTGKQCKNGHIALRHTSKGTCTECNKMIYERDKENILAKAREDYKRNPDPIKKRAREYRKENPEIIKERKRKYYEENKEKSFAIAADRRAMKKQRVPVWAKDSEWHQFALLETYKLARLRGKLTGTTWHVDHIIPLINDKVCGLHVIENLQVITAEENLRKGNRFEIE